MYILVFYKDGSSKHVVCTYSGLRSCLTYGSSQVRSLVMSRLCDELQTGTLHSPGFMLCLLLHTSNDGIREYFLILAYTFHLRRQQVVLSGLLITPQILLTYTLKKFSWSFVAIFWSSKEFLLPLYLVDEV